MKLYNICLLGGYDRYISMKWQLVIQVLLNERAKALEGVGSSLLSRKLLTGRRQRSNRLVLLFSIEGLTAIQLGVRS